MLPFDDPEQAVPHLWAILLFTAFGVIVAGLPGCGVLPAVVASWAALALSIFRWPWRSLFLSAGTGLTGAAVLTGWHQALLAL